MRIKYWIKNNLFRNKKSLIMTLLLVIISITGLASYAIFTTSIEYNNALNIVTGNLYSLIESDDLINNSITLNGYETKRINLTLINNNSIDTKFNLYYLNDKFSVYYNDVIPPNRDGVVIEKYGSNNEVTYSLLIENNSPNSEVITFKSDAGLSTATLVFPSEGIIIEKSENMPNKPSMSVDLIPVTYGSNGEVYKADVTNTDYSWYDYYDKRWANAVTVTTSTKSTYNNASVGTEINMDHIEQMVVWIPRYSYDASSIENASNSIDVTFTKTSETAHPAFCWGNDCQTNRSSSINEEVSGIWIGKFEMGFRDGESSVTSNVSYVVKPNLNSVNNTYTYTMFDKISNISVTNGDFHMIKNTEWGLVAYFSQSKYGVCNSDGTCTSKVATNAYYFNSSTITTGCGPVMNGAIVTDTQSAESCPDESKWNTNIGQEASTTNNIYGIYDMAGARPEHVMGVAKDVNGLIVLSSFGFSVDLEAKYYDVYEYKTSTIDANFGLEGDATKELKGSIDGLLRVNWNNDMAVSPYGPGGYRWYIRGGLLNRDGESSVGIFASGYTANGGDARFGTRGSLVILEG